ncbi:MAG TPA: glucoamylase family protein [Oligoflexia bacterium]|nr:glucoamylase family protein [Oligoflexia bacterium]HMP49441.1 glucoamylase family protein [Oligoflexia bacterium]
MTKKQTYTFQLKELIDKLRAYKPPRDNPMRSEILSTDLLVLHARDIAKNIGTTDKSVRSAPLKSRFKDNCKVLGNVYFALSKISGEFKFLPAGGEWLLDNYHVIDEQVREIRRDLPSGYYKALPKLSFPKEWRGLPQAYRIACDYIEHTDATVQLENLTDYLNAFQDEVILKTSELWAIPIMLRLALVENLRRISESVLSYSRDRLQADAIFELIAEDGRNQSPTELLQKLMKHVSPQEPKLEVIVPYLVGHLRSLGSKSSLGIQWLEEQLREKEIKLPEAARKLQQIQAADQISIGNSITSLKNIGRINWREWVESVSITTRILQSDPSNIFSKSDFETRDHIRHRIETLSRRTGVSEVIVAKKAIELALNQHKNNQNDSRGHVGYFLIDEGFPMLEDALRSKAPAIVLSVRWIRTNATRCYLGALILITLLITFLLGSLISASGFSNSISTILVLLCVIPASQLATDIIQWLTSKLIQPRPLPKLDFEKGVEESAKTAVVVQTIITNQEHLKKTIEDLEIRAIGNQDKNILFGILADLPDHFSEHAPGDKAIINFGCDTIRELNNRYHEISFFIFFRKRQFNSSEQCYMGWERKRGKLIEFNKLIRGDTLTSFNILEGFSQDLLKCKFVITLDNDTQLPGGVARKLIGCAAHPLNTPVIDIKSRTIRRGYGIIQPRVGITLESGSASYFSYLFAGNSGLDPYTKAISDVYQDLFREASYIGKGIYNVDAFEAAVGDRLPENTILSHDLLESGYVRCGLASDLEVFDDFPRRYHANAKRQHRWIRGDWQILYWLFPTVPTPGGKEKNVLSSLVRWKIFDNLRRSLSPISIFAILVVFFGKPDLNASTAISVLFVLLLLTGFRVYSILYNIFFQLPLGYSISGHLSSNFQDLRKNILAWFFELCVLPHQVYISCDAITRSISRMYFSKRNMLEWETALASEISMKGSLTYFFRSMGRSYLITLIFLVVIISSFPQVSPFSLMLLFLWLTSPVIAWYISKEEVFKEEVLSRADQNYLRGVAYDTWRYFRKHLREEYNYLIPDNVQLVPEPVVAERTSPTNISLSLIAITSAYDLGFIPSTALLLNFDKILQTVTKLEKHHGHLLNWYAIRDLQPLLPRYISSVDSGNFIGHLLVAKEALCSYPYSSFLSSSHIEFLGRESFAKEFFSCECSSNATGETNCNNLKNTSSKLYEQILPLIFKAGDASKSSDAINDLKTLQPYTEWLSHLSLFRDLSTRGLVPKKIARIFDIFDRRPLTPVLALKIVSRLLNSRDRLLEIDLNEPEKVRINYLLSALEHSRNIIMESIEKSRALVSLIDLLIEETRFDFLFDSQKKLLSIGYNIDNATLDSGSYDLLASEARLASFVAIAKKDIPQSHWFLLGRALTDTSGGKALISWSGTMFEYLMPFIVMKNYPSTLLGRASRAVVRAQQNYCFRRGVPWGISESAYGTVDFENTYQYRAFGVPGLGLKRGLVDDLVISPYSSALALQISPVEATKNLHALETVGARGEYGFYEAIDYTPERLTGDESFHIVRSFFAHHQGMSLAAINNILNKNPLQERFHKDLRVQSCTLLLQEKFPARIPLILPHQAELLMIEPLSDEPKIPNREHYHSPHQEIPRTHLLSSGDYTVCIDHTGSGFSSYKGEIFLNRFKADSSLNHYGQFIYLRDEEEGYYWSAGYRPTLIEPDSFEAIFAPDKAEFNRRNFDINSVMEIVVSPEDPVEIRKLSLTNHSVNRRTLSATSYFEIALSNPKADSSHPAFSKIFLETEWNEEIDTLLCSRKKRSENETHPVMFHFVSSEIVWAPTQFTTSRISFIGRGRDSMRPVAISSKIDLNRETGFVLDPCASVRQLVELDPGESATLFFVSGFAPDKQQACQLSRKYREAHTNRRAFELAWSFSNVEQKNQQFSKTSTLDFQHLANALIYNIPELRESHDFIPPSLPQSALWRLGISGDEPIVLLYIEDSAHMLSFQELVLAHEYLRARGIYFDLVVLNQKAGGYIQELRDELEASVKASFSGYLLNKNRGIFIRDLNHISGDEEQLLRASAQVILDSAKGTLGSQLKFKSTKSAIRSAPSLGIKHPDSTDKSEISPPRIINGQFTNSGRTYQITTRHNSLTPLPWANVIANKKTGMITTETGAGYSWFYNSRENRLSTWSNDPVSDPHSEIIYIRDCQNSEYWNPTALPVPTSGDVTVEHQPGKSSYKREINNIVSELNLFVSKEEENKFWELTLKSKHDKTRTLELIFFLDWVLGVSREETSKHIRTGIDFKSGFLYANNHWNADFGNGYVIVGSTLPLQDFTTCRSDFLGQFSHLGRPVFLETVKKDALKRKLKSRTTTGTSLSRKTGFGFDSAAILKYEIALEPGETKSITFFATYSDSIDEAKEKVKRLSIESVVKKELSASIEHWDNLLTKVKVKTPEPLFDAMVNTWLPYQTISCRINARTGFYQSSGAFGFRDQLQDSLALLYIDPDVTREQIITNCCRQFEEGDVQHWWHPPSGKGIRSKISDNYLWLPYAVLEYLSVTADQSILNETAPYIKGPQLEEGQHDLYFVPERSDLVESVYHHCLRALKRSLIVGSHGLPLIGAGDWNDGMNLVGAEGKGESIWLGWFLASLLSRFSDLCLQNENEEEAKLFTQHSKNLVAAIEKEGWDGSWYRRAYFDDGTPLGSHERTECRIDSLAQSWASLTDLGDESRRKVALKSAYENLFDKSNQLVRLLWPPFQTSTPNAGYIQSYPPGIRENGGQYTHGSSWLIAALAKEGFNNEAMELFQAMNPAKHTETLEQALKYMTEPYVTCGDVYSYGEHAGRGGWSWYTGSSGWLFQIAIKYLLGINICKDGILFKPSVPDTWNNFEISLFIRGRKLSVLVNEYAQNSKWRLNEKIIEKDLIPWSSLDREDNDLVIG